MRKDYFAAAYLIFGMVCVLMFVFCLFTLGAAIDGNNTNVSYNVFETFFYFSVNGLILVGLTYERKNIGRRAMDILRSIADSAMEDEEEDDE